MKFWNRKSVGHADLESRLRTGRPQARREFVRAVADRVDERSFSRPAIIFAIALTTVLMASLAAFGGIGYAATSTTDTIKAIKATLTQTTTYGLPNTQGGTGGDNGGNGGDNKGDHYVASNSRSCSTGHQSPACNQYCQNTHSASKHNNKDASYQHHHS